MIGLVRDWLAKRCVVCGQPKPLFTRFCDECWHRMEGHWE